MTWNKNRFSGYFTGLFLVASLFFSSCSVHEAGETREVTSTPAPSQAAATFPAQTSTPIPEVIGPTLESMEESNPLSHYEMSVELSWGNRTASVNQVISFVLDAGKVPGEIPLIVEPNLYSNGIEITGLRLDGEDYLSKVIFAGNILKITTPDGFIPQAEHQIEIQYSLNLPAIPPPSGDKKPQPYGFTDRQINLVDWYPFLPPLTETGWIINEPFYYGEYLTYPTADFLIDLKIVDGDERFKVAASSSEKRDGILRRYQLSAGRNFVFSISPFYKTNSVAVGGTLIQGYFFPEDERASTEALNATAQAVALFGNLFGEYKRDALAVVEADFLDGMEYEGLYFLSKGFYNLYDGTPKGYLTIIAVHETAHQWWYGAIANDQAEEPWLDESLATYCEILFYEYQYPELVDWWWAYRVDYYQPEGLINRPVYEYRGFTPYRNAVYLNGAKFLEKFRELVGDEVFFEGIGRYYSSNAGSIVTRSDFFSQFEMQTNSEEFKALILQYFGD